MTLLAGHGLSIGLPGGWEGRIYVADLPAPAVNMPVLHATDLGLTSQRSTFAPEIAARAGGTGTLVALAEFESRLANVGLYERKTLGLPIRRQDLHANALQVPVPELEGHQRFCSLGDRAFALYLVVGTGPGLGERLDRVNEMLGTLEVRPLGGSG
jgi:hypothetical protein